jgi:hypothetical protein
MLARMRCRRPSSPTASPSRGSRGTAGAMSCSVPLTLIPRYYRVSGPDRQSPTALAVRFNKQEITGVARSWLQLSTPVGPQDVPFVALHACTRFAIAQLFINIVRRSARPSRCLSISG